MPQQFSIPNVTVAPTPQSDLQSVDVDALVAGFNQTGVKYGCDVTQRAAGANLSVDVARGVILSNGTLVRISATNIVVAADATNPRMTIIVAALNGTVSAVAGTPTASGTSDPPMPAIPAGSVLLAQVYIAAGVTSIVTANITGRQVILGASVQPNWVDVTKYGAVGDGSTNNDTVFAAAVAQVPVNGTLYIPAGTYVGVVICQSNMRVLGEGAASVLKAAGTSGRDHALSIDYNVHNVEVENVSFDGAGLYGGICIGAFGAGSSIPNDRVNIHDCRFTNNYGQSGNTTCSCAIASYHGPHNSSFRNNYFYDSSGGAMNITNPMNFKIDANIFDNIGYGNGSLTEVVDGANGRQDFIYLNGSNPQNYLAGLNVTITNNVGIDGWRNLIEVQTPVGIDIFRGLVVDGNSLAYKTGLSGNNLFAISVPNAPGWICSNNSLRCADNPQGSAGIELFTQRATVVGNNIFGFQSGVILTGVTGSYILIQGNLIENALNGVEFANDTSSTKDYHYCDVLDNRIMDCRDNAFYANGSAVTVWGGLRFLRNRCVRNLSWAGQTGWSGLATASLGDSHIEVRDNYFSVNTTSGLGGWNGINLNGATNFRHEISGNRFEWIGAGQVGTGINSASNVSDFVIRRNWFTNLGRVIAGLASNTRGIYGENINDNSVDNATPTGFYGLGIPPVAQSVTPTYFYVIGHAAAAPSSGGPYALGNVVFNSAPTADGNIGWVCVVAGSPGTWEQFGFIAPNQSLTVSQTVTSTAVETTFTNTYTVKAGSLAIGKSYRITAHGVYSDVTGPNITLRLKAGATTLATTSAQATPAAQTNRGWKLEAILTAITLGATGSVEIQGMAHFAGASGPYQAFVMDLPNVAAIGSFNTTIDQVLGISAQWGTASANNTITLRSLVFEALP